MTDITTLAEQCESATPDMQRDLLERAWQELYSEYPGSQIHTVSPRGLAMGRMLNANAYVDAALMFVPEGLDVKSKKKTDSASWAYIDPYMCYASTPALAILAASLRAREA